MRVTQRALSLKHFEYSKYSINQPTTNQPTSSHFHASCFTTDTISSIPMETLKAVIGGGGRWRQKQAAAPTPL
jgi:hypothetical protein